MLQPMSAEPCEQSSSDSLLAAALAGSPDAVGQVLQTFRNYLLLIAQEELHRDLQARVGPSDLVQETFVAAQQEFAEFRGTSIKELQAWLRGILLNKVRTAHRFHGAERRDVQREIPLDAGASSARLAHEKPVKANTASRQMAASEEAERISLALSSLSGDYRLVIQLRNWELLPFDEIGRRMQRSAGAARALWVRALEQLADALGPSHD